MRVLLITETLACSPHRRPRNTNWRFSLVDEISSVIHSRAIWHRSVLKDAVQKHRALGVCGWQSLLLAQNQNQQKVHCRLLNLFSLGWSLLETKNVSYFWPNAQAVDVYYEILIPQKHSQQRKTSTTWYVNHFPLPRWRKQIWNLTSGLHCHFCFGLLLGLGKARCHTWLQQSPMGRYFIKMKCHKGFHARCEQLHKRVSWHHTWCDWYSKSNERKW